MMGCTKDLMFSTSPITTEPAPNLSGADAYIRKTFRPHELIDAVISAARVHAA